MRDFFINAYEELVAVIIVLSAIGVIVGAVTVMRDAGGEGATGGIFLGILIIAIGAIGVIIVGGLLYLTLGIYHNTRRSAELLAQIAGRQAPGGPG